MIPIPKYLENISSIETIKKDQLNLKLVCECKSDIFTVYQNKVIKTEKHKLFEKKFTDFRKRCFFSWTIPPTVNGITYAYRKNIFGKIVEILDISEMFETDCTKIIKIKCCQCGKEYVIFDNRFNGYDSIDTTEDLKQKKYDFKQKKFKKSTISEVEVGVGIANEKSLEDFIKVHREEVDMDFYSNAFSWIMIVCFDKVSGKHFVLLDEETR